MCNDKISLIINHAACVGEDYGGWARSPAEDGPKWTGGSRNITCPWTPATRPANNAILESLLGFKLYFVGFYVSKYRHGQIKGENLKKSYFPFTLGSIWINSGNTWSEVRKVLKLLGSQLFKTVLNLTIGHVLPEIIQIEYTKGKKKMGHF